MADDMELDLSTNIEVNGTNSIDQAAQKVEKLAGNADEAESNIAKLSKTISSLRNSVQGLNGQIKPGVDISEIQKAIALIEKGIDASLDKVIPLYAEKLAKEVSGTHNLRTSEGLLAKANAIRARPREEYYEQQHLERLNRRNQGNRIDSELAIMAGRSARDRYYQQSHLNRYADWKENRRNTDPKWRQYVLNQSVQERIEKGYKEKYSFDEASVRFAQKDLDLWAKRLNEEAGIALKRNLESSKKVTDKLYQEKIAEPKKNYYQQQHNERVKNRYYREQHNQRYTNWQNTPLSDDETMRLLMTGKFNADDLIARNEKWLNSSGGGFEELHIVEDKINQALTERAEIEKQKTEKAKEQLNNASSEDKKSAEQAITAAKEEEAKTAEESAENAKKAKKQMTEFQERKVELQRQEIQAQESNTAAYDRRTDVFAASESRKERILQETANSRAFRNAHPELFAPGGQAFNKNYQAARAMSAIGGAVGQLGPVGGVIGKVIESLGAFAKAVPAGIATTVANLAKAVIDFGKAAVQAYSEIESIKTQLGVVFSNSTQANDVFGQISQYAIKSPFGVQQTSELAVLLKQSGVYASDLMDTLKMLGDTAGGNMEKMKRIANNYAQIVSIGKASMLDMRQFAYAGIPIFEAVSKELGVSQQELRKLISDGKVTSDIIEKVFKDLTGINGIFNEATSKGAKTLKARLQNLSDARQLALSSVGEGIVNFGNKYGNDSVVNNIVTGLENFYSWMKEHADVKNIERNVDTIARSDTRIKALEDLLEHAQKTGNKDLERLIKTELELQKNMYDVDKKRSIYSSSYDLKNERYDRYVNQFGKLTEQQIADKLEQATQQLKDVTVGSVGGLKGNLFSYEKILTVEEEAESVVLQQLVQDLKDYQQAIIDVRETTEEEIKANRERNLINAQQLAYDENQKAIGKEGSYASGFEQLYSLWTQSDEYKEQKQKAEIAFLQEAKDALMALKKFVDTEGNLDMTKMSYEQFSKLYNTDKAFEINRKLNVVEGKSQQQMTEDRAILLDQWEDMSNKIAAELAKDNRDHAFRAAQYSQILNGTSNEDFYDRFAKVLTEQLDYLKELKKAAGTKEVREMYDNMYNNLMASTFSLGVNTQGANANPNDIAKGSGQEFIPLWKRIIAQATGLSAEGINKARTAMEDYRDDMAVRTLTSNVMQAIMQSGGGVSSAMALAKAGNQVARLKGTTPEVVQIDWKSTREAVSAFANQLSASTQVITAYKNALEEELSTYQSLVAAGYTTAETQEIKNQRYISDKTYKRLMETAGSQLVNAFGENLVTKEGQEVWLGDNGKFYDSEEAKKNQDKEHEVNVEELVLTEDMFDYIKQILPKIEKELHEANATALKNKVLEDMLNEVKNTRLQRLVNNPANNLDRQTSQFLFNNPEYLSEYFDSALGEAKNRFKDEKGNYLSGYEFLNGLSDNDILLESLKGDKSEFAEQIAEIIAIALNMVSEDTSALLNSEQYKTAKEKYDRNDARSAANLRRQQYNDNYEGQLSPNAWLDEGGYALGQKFVKDFFDVEKAYTMKDLYEAYAEEMHIMVEEMTLLDKMTLIWKESMQDIEDVCKSMSESIVSLAGDLGKKAWLTPFENLGEYKMKEWVGALEEGEELTEMNAKAMKELGAEALQALGPIIAKAGFELVARGAMNGDMGLVLAGLGLAATGGFATGIGNAIKDQKDNTDNDKEAEKLQALTDQLKELLEQARKDALYYENNLRHKTALGINKDFSMKSVNDAIITPQGDIVTTDPKDYLIATKQPNQLVGGNGVSVTPIINCNVINNTGAKVRQEQSQNADGSIDIITIIEDTVGNYIASSKSDDAFNSREYRIKGRQSIMN